jgi:hypothetical protein
VGVEEVIVRGKPGVRLHLHPRMTIVSGQDDEQRPVLRRLLAAALAGNQPGSEVVLSDGLGRRLQVRGWANAPAISLLDTAGEDMPVPDAKVLPAVSTIGPDDLAATGDGPRDTPAAKHARASALQRLLGLAARARSNGAIDRCPPVLVLDDAFSQLDAGTTWDLLELAERLAFQSGVQVVYLTGDPVVVGWARTRSDAGRIGLCTTTAGSGPEIA